MTRDLKYFLEKIQTRKKADLIQKERMFALFQAFCEPNYPTLLDLEEDYPALIKINRPIWKTYAQEYWLLQNEITEIEVDLNVPIGGCLI